MNDITYDAYLLRDKAEHALVNERGEHDHRQKCELSCGGVDSSAQVQVTMNVVRNLRELRARRNSGMCS